MAAKAHGREREKYQPVDEEAAWKEFMAQFPADAEVSLHPKPALSAPPAPRASPPTEGQAEVHPRTLGAFGPQGDAGAPDLMRAADPTTPAQRGPPRDSEAEPGQPDGLLVVARSGKKDAARGGGNGPEIVCHRNRNHELGFDFAVAGHSCRQDSAAYALPQPARRRARRAA